MASDVLQLDESDFWDNPEKTRKVVIDKVIKEDFLGLLIDGPSYVSLDDRESCPIAGYYVRTLREDQQVDSDTQLFALAVDQTTGDMRWGLAVNTGKTMAPEDRPTGDPGKGTTLDGFVSDLRRQIDLPWRPARHRVHTIVRERLSNAATVELGPSKTKFQDPEVAKYLASRQVGGAPPPPRRVWPPAWAAAEGLAEEHWPEPADRIPSYGPDVEGPAIPEAPGIALEIDRVVELTWGARCLLRGSFRLPVRRREVVRPDAESGERPLVGDAKATGVVPINLFITGSENPGPWVLTLRVPVYEPLALEGDPGEATGRFVVDLLSMANTPQRAMTYFTYAFNGECATGPVPYALITPPVL